MKYKVLIFAGYYVPSVKGGGPIQSIKNLVDNLSDKIDFFIVAADRDLGDDKPFSNIKIDKWLQVGNANVFYTDQSKLTWRKTAEIINSVDYDVIYLNSFFSFKNSTVPILLNKYKRISRKPIIMAPRGQFSEGALGLKNIKKKLYIKIAKAFGWYEDIIWHATAETEKKDIEKIFDYNVNIKISNNLTSNYKGLNFDKNIRKITGELKIVFISRIHPKKNLKKSIEFLKELSGKVEFNIYGPIEDKVYWSECESIIERLPQNIKVSYKGIVNHDRIIDVFKLHHVFLFPTLGENFGHVISEALIGGCPLIISDQTPWIGLQEQNIGWDIPLSDEKRFRDVLQTFVDMGKEEYDFFSRNAFEYGKKASNKREDVDQAFKLFKQYP